MVKPSRAVLALTVAALVISMAISGCSSSDDDDAVGSAAAGSSADPGSSPDQASGSQQQFDLTIVFTSPVFNEKKRIPKKHTCTKQSGNEPNVSPPLAWEGVPEGTKSIALIVDSKEIVDTERVHWVIWNIPADVRELSEGVPNTESLDSGASQGSNGSGGIGYLGPCPPFIVISQDDAVGSVGSAGKFDQSQKIEKYTFRIYALDSEIDLAPGATKSDLLQALDGRVLAGGELVGERQGPRMFDQTNY